MKYFILILLTIICIKSVCLAQNRKSDSSYYIDKSGNWVFKYKPGKQVIGKKYFLYDYIEMFNANLKFSQVENIYFNQPKSEMDSIKRGIYFGEIPRSILDSSILNKLIDIGYKKSIINKSKFYEIDQIFVEKTTETNEVSFCINIFRDILVFKKEGKIVGIAKICFECDAKLIVGTTSNTANFGQDGDYTKLKEILREK